MTPTTDRQWARGFRAPIMVLLVLATIMGSAPRAEAKKKAPVDPAVVVGVFNAALDALADDADAQIETLTLSMTADFDAAVAKGSTKQVLRLQGRYESRIRKFQGKQQKALGKHLAKARKSLASIEGRPVALMQVEDLAAEYAMELEAAAADLTDQLGQLVFDAMVGLSAKEPAAP